MIFDLSEIPILQSFPWLIFCSQYHTICDPVAHRLVQLPLFYLFIFHLLNCILQTSPIYKYLQRYQDRLGYNLRKLNYIKLENFIILRVRQILTQCILCIIMLNYFHRSHKIDCYSKDQMQESGNLRYILCSIFLLKMIIRHNRFVSTPILEILIRN